MFHLLDDALAAHLRADIPLDSGVNTTFVMPDSNWSAGLTRPVISLYLWDVKRDVVRANTGIETVVRNGVTIRRAALPKAKVCYFASVWAGTERDEHLLLGRLVQSVMRHRYLPDEIVPAGLIPDGSRIEIGLGGRDSRAAADFWGAIDGTFRPGVEIELSVPIDIGLGTEVGQPVSGVETRTSDRSEPSRTSTRSSATIEEQGTPDT